MSTREIAEQTVQGWVEHGLDEHHEPGAEFTITMPPDDLIERFTDALTKAIADERVRCAMLLCAYCAKGVELDADGDHVWPEREEGGHKIHQWEPCTAAAIRRDDTADTQTEGEGR